MTNKSTTMPKRPSAAPGLTFAESVWKDIADLAIIRIQASGKAINKAAVWKIEDVLDLADRRGLSHSALDAFLVELQTPPSDGDDYD